MIVAQECLDCEEVFDEDFQGSICPFCNGRIDDVVEIVCKNCGEVFEGIFEDNSSCPFCAGPDLELLD